MSEIAYLQHERERTIASMKQAIEDYIHGDPETTRFRFFLPSDQNIDEVKRAAAQASLKTGKRIELIYPVSSTREDQG